MDDAWRPARRQHLRVAVRWRKRVAQTHRRSVPRNRIYRHRRFPDDRGRHWAEAYLARKHIFSAKALWAKRPGGARMEVSHHDGVRGWSRSFSSDAPGFAYH